MVLSSPTLLLAAALSASSIILLPVQSLQIKPSPPSYPPKPLSSSLSSYGSGRLPTTGAAATPRSSKQRRLSTTPLRAYTVSDNSKNKNPWMSFMKFPTSFGDLASQFGAEDSLFSFEGGSDAVKAAAAKKPYMPNLEMETAAIIATATKKLEIEGMDFTMEKDELLSELDILTKTFDDLQSSMDYKSQLYSETMEGYQSKIVTLEEKNDLLEEGLSVLTVTLERQEEQIEKLLLQRETDDDDDGATKEGEQHLIMQVQDEGKNLDKENEMLRQRLRFLEVELSDVAFESRKVVMSDPRAVVEKQTDNAVVVVAASADNDVVKLTPKAPSAPVPPHIYQQRQLELIPDPPIAVDTLTDDALNSSSEAVVVAAGNDIKLTPKAPSAPVPPHIYQQQQLEQLQQQVNEYKRERSSVRKLFGLGIRRGVTKAGKALNLWSPAYNLLLWGELRRQ